MEVTRENFKTLLPSIEADIDEAEFFAIDGEFTGLNNGAQTSTYDTPAEYYRKLKHGAMDFLFFQFGLATFKFDDATKKYTYKTYNFYLFPRPDSKTRHVPDSRFLCQSSCINFLAEHGFDFNKVFKEGISYLNCPAEKKALDLLEERRKNLLSSENDIIPVPSDFELCVENACAQVEDFIKSEDKEREIVLLKNNGFAKKLVHQQVAKRFSAVGVGLFMSQKTLLARKNITRENKEKEMLDKYNADKNEIHEAVGFTLVMKKLAQSGKLIVGHNCLIDLCHILNQFFTPLPDDYSEFKCMLHDIFPKLLDTKYMCCVEPLNSLLPTSILSNLMPVLSESPFNLPEVVCIDQNYGYESNTTKNHEAGFDAYITGLVFIAFSKFLSGNSSDSINTPISKQKTLEPYINRLHLMKINDTYINICGSDPLLSRDHVFYVTFPSIWRFKQISDLFRPVGNILVSWINDVSAWVALSNQELAPRVATLIDTSCFDDVTIQSYEERKRLSCRRWPNEHETCSTAQQQIFSPDTSSVLKKRKREVQSTATSAAPAAAVVAAGKRRSRSIGRESFSRKSFETIPEETEEVDSPIRKRRLIDECEKTPKREKLMQFDENDSWD